MIMLIKNKKLLNFVYKLKNFNFHLKEFGELDPRRYETSKYQKLTLHGSYC